MWIVFESRDGSSTLLSEKFGVTYHSKYGALQESSHVFIKEGLFFKCIAKKELKILEMGFGTGLNALLTLQKAASLGLKIEYTALEQFPIDIDVLSKLNYCEKLGMTNGQCFFNHLHNCPWEDTVNLSDHFSIIKRKQAFEESSFDPTFDIIYYDAFAPNVQPELWEAPIMQNMYDALIQDGILVTYCAKGDFKRTLKSIGFDVKTLKGPPGKREMVRAIKS